MHKRPGPVSPPIETNKELSISQKLRKDRSTRKTTTKTQVVVVKADLSMPLNQDSSLESENNINPMYLEESTYNMQSALDLQDYVSTCDQVKIQQYY